MLARKLPFCFALSRRYELDGLCPSFYFSSTIHIFQFSGMIEPWFGHFHTHLARIADMVDLFSYIGSFVLDSLAHYDAVSCLYQKFFLCIMIKQEKKNQNGTTCERDGPV
jgi:hypothetical protein